MLPQFKKKFGFGCMRLPMDGERIDIPQATKMVDAFMNAGFNYFDTAHIYLKEQSETALRECLTSRYPRNSYILTNKLTQMYIEEPEDVRPLFEKQLEACGVEYFDFYLFHAMRPSYYEKFSHCNAFETVKALKAEGKIRHIGMSFHDEADFLEEVLLKHPEIEVVQLQFNYLDFDNPTVQSYECYKVCEKYGKPVLVMEPIKGGTLAALPPAAGQVLDALGGGSHASYALRYCAEFPNIAMILSGMSNLAQMEENISFMADPLPLSQEEHAALEQVRNILRAEDLIPCTSCRYCMDGCPQNIAIADFFACLNAKKQYKDWSSDYKYSKLIDGKAKASDCIKCGQCEGLCPQNLEIRKLLEDVASTFEKE